LPRRCREEAPARQAAQAAAGARKAPDRTTLSLVAPLLSVVAARPSFYRGRRGRQGKTREEPRAGPCACPASARRGLRGGGARGLAGAQGPGAGPVFCRAL